MFLHLQVPGFHAAVHQARLPSLRGRPVAVAVDAGLQSPLLSTSQEARRRHVIEGMRADEALRRCPDLQVVTPDPEMYREAQRQLTALCARFAPRVGGSAGRLDLDVSGTWHQGINEVHNADARSGAAMIASSLRSRCARELHLDAYVGGGPRLVIARLAAALARSSQLSLGGTTIISAGEEKAATNLMPIVLLTDCDAHIRELLERCAITTIGQLRALSADHLISLVKPSSAHLYNVVHGLRKKIIPEILDPEPSVIATCRAGEGGAGLEGVQGMIHVLAREMAFQLHRRHLACTRLILDMGWCDARTAKVSVDLRYQTTADHALAAATNQLFAQHARPDVRIDRLSLVAAGLCSAEFQQEWLGGGRPIAAETTTAYDAGSVKPTRSARANPTKRQRQ
ncbi:MAG TPA: hypothetical protein VHX44_10165 [Planctomycetota bacterium]|nr:hypothetical protein [Planctomycetota bacterium]